MDLDVSTVRTNAVGRHSSMLPLSTLMRTLTSTSAPYSASTSLLGAISTVILFEGGDPNLTFSLFSVV